MTSDDGIEAEIDGLYQVEHREFVACRNGLAQRLRTAGRAGLADRVRGLPKPSVSAWAVNQLWWRHQSSFDRLLRAGAELVVLQQRGVSTAGQSANEDRRRAIAELLGLARELLDRAGHTTSMSTLRKVTISLEASAAWAGSLRGPGAGRLHTELAPPGFGEVVGLAPSSDPTTPAAEPRESRRARARARLEQARLEQARATRELDDARTVAASARAARVNAEAALARARETLAETQAVETQAESRLAAATATSGTADTTLNEARAALQEELPADTPDSTGPPEATE